MSGYTEYIEVTNEMGRMRRLKLDLSTRCVLCGRPVTSKSIKTNEMLMSGIEEASHVSVFTCISHFFVRNPDGSWGDESSDSEENMNRLSEILKAKHQKESEDVHRHADRDRR